MNTLDKSELPSFLSCPYSEEFVLVYNVSAWHFACTNQSSYCRLEMSAELLRQKELENVQRQRLLAEPLALHPGLPAEHPALRSLHDMPDDVTRRNAMLLLRHNNTPLLSLSHQGAMVSSAFKESSNRRSSKKGVTPQVVDPSQSKGTEGDTDGHDEDMKDSESDGEVGEERPEGLTKADGHSLNSDACQSKDTSKPSEALKELREGSGRLSVPCSSTAPESPNHHLFRPGLSKSEAKYLPPGALPPFPILPGQTLPFGFPYANPYFHAGEFWSFYISA